MICTSPPLTLLVPGKIDLHGACLYTYLFCRYSNTPSGREPEEARDKEQEGKGEGKEGCEGEQLHDL